MNNNKLSKQQLRELAAPVLDDNFPNMIVSAVRYALPRHSYMPSLTRDYVKRHWPAIAKMHWCVLRDIREYIADAVRNECLYGENMFTHDHDLQEWIEFYDQMATREDTVLDSYNEHLRAPINPAAIGHGE